MNLLLLDSDEVTGGRATVTGRRARHLIDVLGVDVGATVRAGVARGPTGTAIVAASDGDRVELALALDGEPASRPPIDLILAVPRPKVLKRVLQAAASFGVDSIALVNAWRVEKSYFHSPALAPEALREQLWLGCEQGGTTWLPSFGVHPLLMPFVEGDLRATDDRARVLLHPRASAGLETIVVPGSSQRIVAAIGPEGGWIDRELATFEHRGFAPVSLTNATLRTEAAVTAVFAQLHLLPRLRPTANSQ